jgi:hypothetical protein
VNVFLSYTSADKAIASRLASALRAQNIHVWFDEDVIRPGGNIIEQIRQGLQQADALVVILSHSYIESNWAQHELSTWRLTEAAHRRQVIIPVRIDDAPLPLSLLDRVYLDIRDETFEEAVTKLVAALQQHAQLEAEAPAVSRQRRHHLRNQRCWSTLLPSLWRETFRCFAVLASQSAPEYRAGMFCCVAYLPICFVVKARSISRPPTRITSRLHR